MRVHEIRSKIPKRQLRTTTGAPLALAALAVAALLITAIPALARPHGPGGGFGWGLLGGGPMLEHIAERLELAPDQQESLHGLFDSYRPQLEGQRDLMRSARTALRRAIHADPFDEAAIRQAAADVAALEADLAVTRALIAREIRQILTPEQLAEATRMMEDARAWREHAGQRFGGRRGRPAIGED